MVKLTVLLLCVCVHSAWKGRPQNDLYCVGWTLNSTHSLTHSLAREQVCHQLSSEGVNRWCCSIDEWTTGSIW